MMAWLPTKCEATKLIGHAQVKKKAKPPPKPKRTFDLKAQRKKTVPPRSVLQRLGRVGGVIRSKLLPTKEYAAEVPLLELLAPFILLQDIGGTITLHWKATKTDPATKRTVEWAHFSTSLPKAARRKKKKRRPISAARSAQLAGQRLTAAKARADENAVETKAKAAEAEQKEAGRKVAAGKKAAEKQAAAEARAAERKVISDQKAAEAKARAEKNDPEADEALRRVWAAVADCKVG